MTAATYLFEANTALVLLGVYYFLFLKNETDFTFQRLFILFGMLCSVAFPLIQINGVTAIPSTSKLASDVLPEFTISENQFASGASNGFDFYNVLLCVYLLVAAVLLLKLIDNSVNLIMVLKRGSPKSLNLPGYVSFSFLNKMFIGSDYSSEDQRMICAHETVHAKLLHSVDVLFIELLKIAFWFNPVVYLLRKEINQIHEFQADDVTVKSHDVQQYCSLLARAALKSADYPIANHFNQSFTLKRITMITHVKTKLSWWKIISSAMLLTLLFAFISCEEVRSQKDISQNDEAYAFVEEPAEPIGGMDGLREYIAKNLIYPATAKQNRIEGKVNVQFIINKDGRVSDVSVTKGISLECDEAAVRVVANTKWKPGKQDGRAVRQKFTMPIYFKLDK
ncbi:MAG: TonB family protein [Bacteroidetes bacterium]|nr:TonB family protein [Bacteroidota bacterium]